MLSIAANRPARVLVVGGCLLAGAAYAEFLIKALRDGAPFVVAIFGLYIFAFVAVTRASVPVPSATIAVGGLAGLTAVLVPAVVLMLRSPVPRSSAWALVVVGAALVAPAVVTPLRRRARPVDAVVSGLLSGVIAALLIGPVVTAMAQFGPESWVPRMVSHALTPAARLAERRDLAGEPYLLISLLGAVLALVLGVLALSLREPARRAPAVRTIEMRPPPA
jgi:hypothetical protein